MQSDCVVRRVVLSFVIFLLVLTAALSAADLLANELGEALLVARFVLFARFSLLDKRFAQSQSFSQMRIIYAPYYFFIFDGACLNQFSQVNRVVCTERLILESLIFRTLVL